MSDDELSGSEYEDVSGSDDGGHAAEDYDAFEEEELPKSKLRAQLPLDVTYDPAYQGAFWWVGVCFAPEARASTSVFCVGCNRCVCGGQCLCVDAVELRLSVHARRLGCLYNSVPVTHTCNGV
jgi:hypothetical protein